MASGARAAARASAFTSRMRLEILIRLINGVINKIKTMFVSVLQHWWTLLSIVITASNFQRHSA